MVVYIIIQVWMQIILMSIILVYILNEKLLLEKNKEINLMGNFNINLLRYYKDHNSTDFLNHIYTGSLIPHIPYMPYSPIKNLDSQYIFNWYSKWSIQRRYYLIFTF